MFDFHITAGNDVEWIETIKATLSPTDNTQELDEKDVDNLLWIMKKRREERK